MPLITLAARKSSPDRLEFRYAESISQITLDQIDIAPLKGNWVNAEEKITYGEKGVGEYEVFLSNYPTGDTIFYYYSNSIRTWKTSADFLRPKWGIYRSLNDSTSLKDEVVLFADFSIEEMTSVSISDEFEEPAQLLVYPNPSQGQLFFSEWVMENGESFSIYNLHGQLVLKEKIQTERVLLYHLPKGTYFLQIEKEDRAIKAVRIILDSKI